jgi:glycosyltransferase involved in cell wall biosynthesis
VTTAPARPRVSVIVPCRNEARYIAACLDSILAAAYPVEQLEVLIVDGMSDDGTREIIAQYHDAHDHIRLLDNPERIVPTAMNIGIRASAGEVIVRMDAHVVYPPEYIPRLVQALQETDADNVGGLMITLPADGTPDAQAIAMALGHPFGVGNAHFRIGAKEARYVDTVPFGCYRRDVFQRVGMFDEELVRNQDDEFNNRLIRDGGRILLLPDIVCYYYARGSFRQIARMFYQYGAFKPLVARKVGRVTTWRQLVPAAFVAGLTGSALLGFFWQPAAWAAAVIAGTYALAVLGTAARVLRSHGLRVAMGLAAVFPVIHFSYGLGFLRGLRDGVFGRQGRWRDPAVVRLSR